MNARTHHDETPLMEAVDHGHPDVVELLIKFEADVNARTTSGKTALHGAQLPPAAASASTAAAASPLPAVAACSTLTAAAAAVIVTPLLSQVRLRPVVTTWCMY